MTSIPALYSALLYSPAREEPKLLAKGSWNTCFDYCVQEWNSTYKEETGIHIRIVRHSDGKEFPQFGHAAKKE